MMDRKLTEVGRHCQEDDEAEHVVEGSGKVDHSHDQINDGGSNAAKEKILANKIPKYCYQTIMRFIIMY